MGFFYLSGMDEEKERLLRIARKEIRQPKFKDQSGKARHYFFNVVPFDLYDVHGNLIVKDYPTTPPPSHRS